MASRDVRIMLPVDNRVLTVELDDGMQLDQLINELIQAGELPHSAEGYQIAKKGGATFIGRETIGQLALSADDVLRIIPRADAG